MVSPFSIRLDKASVSSTSNARQQNNARLSLLSGLSSSITPASMISETFLLRVVIKMQLPFSPFLKRALSDSWVVGSSFQTSSNTRRNLFPATIWLSMYRSWATSVTLWYGCPAKASIAAFSNPTAP
ncbi:hypothetical protein DsansV1_C01g0005011 [Dioscorea sansibarensis]